MPAPVRQDRLREEAHRELQRPAPVPALIRDSPRFQAGWNSSIGLPSGSSSARAARTAEPNDQVAFRYAGEGRSCPVIELEAEVLGIEGDRTIDVLGQITDCRHGSVKNVVCP